MSTKTTSRLVGSSARTGRIVPTPTWGPEVDGVRSGPVIVITGGPVGREAAPESKATKEGRQS